MQRVGHRDHGGVAVITAVVVAFVMLGVLAISVDVGFLKLERGQLQNAADATSLALAQECASGDDCGPEQVTQVADLLGDNAWTDGQSRFDTNDGRPDGACGRGVDLPECSTELDVAVLEQCPPLPNWLTEGDGAAVPYVETYTNTRTEGGGNGLLPWFGQTDGEVTQTTCARAAWGAVADYTATVPITFSTCEWDQQTDGGLNYVDRYPDGVPGYGAGNPWPDASEEVVIRLHQPRTSETEAPDCTWNGKDSPGGFGYVMTNDGSKCLASVSTDKWVRIDTGNNNPCGGKMPQVGTVIALPVFDCLISQKDQPVGGIPTGTNCDPTKKDSSGANQWYHIAGWAKFYLSGYKLSGSDSGKSIRDNSNTVLCSGEERCLFGWYLKGTLDASPGDIVPPGGSNDFGTFAVKPAG